MKQQHTGEHMKPIREEPAQESPGAPQRGTSNKYVFKPFKYEFKFFLSNASFFSSNVLLEPIQITKRKSGVTYALFEKDSCL